MGLPQDWKLRVPTVSQLTRRLRGHVEGTFFDVWVRGEISNYRKPASGHAYLVLKDAGASMRICIFRPALSKLKFALEDGMEVLVHGRISVYEPRGEYQLVGDAVEPVGSGALQAAFEQLKAKLAEEGLFSAERKRPLPTLPRRIGILTSPTGAAVRDILNVLSRRFADREIYIFPASVQGAKAAPEIVAAFEQVTWWNTHHPDKAIEVLIAGRGGGSLEDLWPFNEESVARAIAACPVPTISAVGHETDFTIADFVADLRAPTPSAAAEIAVPRKEDLVFQVEALEKRLLSPLRHGLQSSRLRLSQMGRRLVSPGQRLALLRQSFTSTDARLKLSIAQALRRKQERTSRASGKLDALSPLRVLSRGFALASVDGAILRSASLAKPGQKLHTRLSDGVIVSEVLSTEPVPS
ncbi:exodeoxyribonuclease VII large subunit [bacterium]|nr:exodeoxyribonuclease VII large subunit [bacterium]